MKQILQDLRSGKLELADIPSPAIGSGNVRIQTRNSLVSAGTERMLVEFSQANLLQKARSQPDKVKQVLDKIKSDGLLPTLETVFSRLDEPLPLGYSNAGVVLESDSAVSEFQPGDRVVSNGRHAEIVTAAENLLAGIPDNVSDEEASFTVISSIGLQGVRLTQPTLGERFVVFGLGLIGLITVQLLRAHGCHVLGVDLIPERLELGGEFGAETVNAATDDPVSAAREWTSGNGIDGVLITASAKTDQIMHQAADMCRKRARIVLIGVVNLNLKREDFYEKEITFQVSCSYGPGRYDEKYEQDGQDYPFGFVRWTEQRNFQAILEMMADGRLDVKPLISHRFKLTDATKAYATMQHNPAALGIILEYPDKIEQSPAVSLSRDAKFSFSRSPSSDKQPVIGIIGAGLFTKSVIMPNLCRTDTNVKYIASKSGVSSSHLARKYDIDRSVTDYSLILEDDDVDAVIITVQHHLHARLVQEALKAGKHVFVEKPLAIREEELDDIVTTYNSLGRETGGAEDNEMPSLMVGFNRRFSPHTDALRKFIGDRKYPLCMTMTVNAGELPPTHWLRDPERGGGRIIGEGCHFIDLLSYIAGSPVVKVYSSMLGNRTDLREDNVTIGLTFADGSIGNLNYFSNGASNYPKETLQVFCDGNVIKNENFRITRGYGKTGLKKFRTRRQDKGHQREIAAFTSHLRKRGDLLIQPDSLINVTRASIAAVRSGHEEKIVEVPV